MRRSRLAWLGLCLSWGCGAKAVATAPNMGDCTTCVLTGSGGTNHVPREGGSGQDTDANDSPLGDAAMTANDAGAVSVTVTLSLLADPAFAKPTGNSSTRVIVSAFDPSGGVVDTGSVGVIPPEPLDGVAVGPNWFAVQEATAAVPTIAATLQPAIVGAKNPTVALSALNAGQLSNSSIDGELLGGTAPGEATVVLVFQKAGQSVSGISVTGNPGTSAVAYYTGGGTYQTQDKGTNGTGAESTVIVTHVPAAARFPQRASITLAGHLGQSAFDIPVSVSQTFATWMLVDVP